MQSIIKILLQEQQWETPAKPLKQYIKLKQYDTLTICHIKKYITLETICHTIIDCVGRCVGLKCVG